MPLLPVSVISARRMVCYAILYLSFLFCLEILFLLFTGSTVKQVSATGNFNLVTVDTANRQMYFTNYANHRGNTMINGLTASNIDNGTDSAFAIRLRLPWFIYLIVGQVRESNVTFVAGVTDNLYAQFLNAIPNSQSVVGYVFLLTFCLLTYLVAPWSMYQLSGFLESYTVITNWYDLLCSCFYVGWPFSK